MGAYLASLEDYMDYMYDYLFMMTMPALRFSIQIIPG